MLVSLEQKTSSGKITTIVLICPLVGIANLAQTQLMNMSDVCALVSTGQETKSTEKDVSDYFAVQRHRVLTQSEWFVTVQVCQIGVKIRSA